MCFYSCGAMTHDLKSCMERPRRVGAKWTDKNIAPDEKIETFELDYDGKRDRWNGYDAASYAYVIERYEARDESRKKYLKEQQLKKLEEKNGNESGEDGVSDEDDNEDDLKVDEAKVDESKQMDFAKVEKRVRTTGGGSTGTVRYFSFIFFFLLFNLLMLLLISCHNHCMPQLCVCTCSLWCMCWFCDVEIVFSICVAYCLHNLCIFSLSGTCVSERTRRNTFLILTLTLLTMIQKPDPCVRIPFQIWIPTRNFMQ